MKPTILHLSILMFAVIMACAVISFGYVDEQCQRQGGELVREPLEWVCVNQKSSKEK